MKTQKQITGKNFRKQLDNVQKKYLKLWGKLHRNTSHFYFSMDYTLHIKKENQHWFHKVYIGVKSN